MKRQITHTISSITMAVVIRLEDYPKYQACAVQFTTLYCRVFRFLFRFVWSRKTATPVLPIQNTSTEPLLVQTSDDSFTFTDNDEGVSECEINVDVLSWPEEKQGDGHLVLSIPKYAQKNVDSEEEKKEENVRIQSCEERWINHYSNRHRILLVGEGDFSFSAEAFSSASNIIATSLNSQAASNIEKLRNREGKVIHEIDATKMANHPSLQHLKFDRIIFNFPYAGLANINNTPRESQLRSHRRLVDLFLENAREMISENGEIHISHKINGFHVEFKLESIASSHRLRLIEAVKFNYLDYPGYNTKCGFWGDRYFNCNPTKTYKFGLKKDPTLLTFRA